VAYGTITTISESEFQFGLIYVGTDDGHVHLTENSGGSWTRISDSFPKDLWVSRVIASTHQKDRVYVTLNGYRWDDFSAYVYLSEDKGKSWKSISSNIPMSPVNVIKEDPANADVLYLGTDNGAYVSFDRGSSWEVFSKGLPNVAFHDLVVQARDKHLLLGTHGRSIYKADISALQNVNPKLYENPVTVFSINPVRHSRQWGRSWNQWFDAFTPSTTVSYYANSASKNKLRVLSKKGTELFSMDLNPNKGFNYATYDLTMTEAGKKALMKEDSSLNIGKAQNGKYYLPKGTYKVMIGKAETDLNIE
ncbi:MAG: glycosyl hydrolase, partial [Bacteroidia bacterium]|nr:glycosyl hydrolase [Bacteroidia bacterium]